MHRGFDLAPMLLACAAASGCGGGPTSPAGRVAAQPSAVSLGYPDSVAVRLDWEPARVLDQRGRPVVFVHLAVPGDRKNVVLRTFDHALPDRWIAGHAQSDELELYQSALSEPIPKGRYVLALGLYDDGTGERWPLQASGPEVARREYQVATVEVTGPDSSAPRFEFAGAWLPVERLGNRQVLDRRCFTGASAIAVEASAAGAARLLVTTPPRGPAQVRVTASCAAGWSEVVGPESRKWVGVEVKAGRCEISLEPALRREPVPGGQPPACLEVLAWRAAAPTAP